MTPIVPYFQGDPGIAAEGYRGEVRRRRIAGAAVLVATLIAMVLLGASFLRPDSPALPALAVPTPTATDTASPPASPVESTPTRQPQHTASAPPPCAHPAASAFTPSSIAIPQVTPRAHVLALGYDARGVPGVPPLTSEGKTEFAWVPEVRPGSTSGNVLLNAHTWPDGTALGNHLLAGLQIGSRIVVHGGQGEELCYRVSQRVEVAATASVPAYFDTFGPPQLAIIVCSGIRRGPGDWTERTIWYASPLL
jgi:hypothetical protein